jgi:hypothetical protein
MRPLLAQLFLKKVCPRQTEKIVAFFSIHPQGCENPVIQNSIRVESEEPIDHLNDFIFYKHKSYSNQIKKE